MAALNKKKNNDGSYRYSIQFYLDGARKTIGIGSKYTQSEMGRMVSIIERLAGYRDTDTVPDPRILQQAESLPNEIKTALAKIKLICHTGQIKVGELWERYIDSSCDKKECTLISIKQVAKNFLEYFESDVSIDTISEADADSWKRHLKQKFAPATIAGFIAQTKSAFTFAVRNKWINDSPFRWIKKGSYRNPGRQFFVPPEWVPSILDACSCQEWRVLFALARFGGLRIPSESSELRWSDILWDKNRFYIRSRKTEAHEGHEGRMSPLWPELKTELETLWDMVEEGGSEVVLGPIRNTSNPATTFKKIIVLPVTRLGPSRSKTAERPGIRN